MISPVRLFSRGPRLETNIVVSFPSYSYQEVIFVELIVTGHIQ